MSPNHRVNGPADSSRTVGVPQKDTRSDEIASGPDADPITALSSARSRSGTVSVTTTPQGLPMHVRIENSALAKDESVLAAEILRLCQQSAMVAGIRIREHLIATGVSREIVDEMKLPRPDDLARAEQRDDHDDAPASWLRSV